MAYVRFCEPLTAAEREWLERKAPFPPRCLRTTMACHMIFANLNVEMIRQRLGHTSLKLLVHHYDKHPVPDVGTREPAEYYRLPEALTVDGVNLWEHEKPPVTGGC